MTESSSVDFISFFDVKLSRAMRKNSPLLILSYSLIALQHDVKNKTLKIIKFDHFMFASVNIIKSSSSSLINNK